MNDYSIKLKNALETYFSMPFVVTTSVVDGEIHYICHPENDGEIFFNVEVFVHNQIRLIVEIYPQKHGGYILNEMSAANLDKQETFYQFVSCLKSECGIRLNIIVNGKDLLQEDIWPSEWKSLSAKISLLPIPEAEEGDFKIISEWCQNGFELFFSLLTIEERSPNEYGIQTEGQEKEVISKRYERNPINRKLCLYRKGYNCSVCGMNFYKMYGKIGYHFIEVHHTIPVSQMGENYKFNVIRDLVPLCSNCHSMIHRRNPPYTVEELKNIIQSQKD